MHHIKSAAIPWPDDEGTPNCQMGLIFISHFHPWVVGESIQLAQREKDLEVRKWLEESGGLGVDLKHQLQWVSLLDTKLITLNGIRPQRCDLKWPDGPISNEEFKAKFQAEMERIRASIRRARDGLAADA